MLMKSCMVLRRGLVASLMFLLLSGIQSVSAQGKLHLLKFDDVTQLRDFFKYTGNGSIIVSGHRGGYEEGYSENCIEGLENVLKQMPAFFEIDPRLTKDSVIVLMHDATLYGAYNEAVFSMVGENGRKALRTKWFRHVRENGLNISKRFFSLHGLTSALRLRGFSADLRAIALHRACRWG